MKTLAILLPLLMGAGLATGGESTLTTTYQPLDGLGSGEVTVVPVTCHHWYASSAGSAVDLIHARNVPPTDNPKEAKQDLNLASRCGLRFSTNDLGDEESAPMILLDAVSFDESKSGGYPKEDIVRASLECLRRCLPEKLKSTKITLKCLDEDREWLSKIVAEFDSAPRDKPFFVAE
ncbi:MAG: hypothetical protein EOP88_05930 [Verrucomicrobiaceae bacterium]|nr:MAG: hypothetical protein EOP88_05930 [Verrucomicrobiaceae bacterium]